MSDTLKRQAIFNYYKARGDVICVQESHGTDEMMEIWQNEFGGEILYSNSTGASKGVCILIKKNLSYRINAMKKDEDGRIIICELEDMADVTKKIVLCNIYAPNTDKPNFFAKCAEMLEQLSENVILIGDFNLVMDPAKDRKNSKK